MCVGSIIFMPKSVGERILRTIPQYVLSFLFLNGIAAFITYVIYPNLASKHGIPIEICYNCGLWDYFNNFGLEFTLLLVGSISGFFLSQIIIRILEKEELDFLIKFFSHPLPYIAMMFLPLLIYFTQLDKGNSLIFDGNVNRLIPFILIIISNFSFLMLIHEKGKYIQNSDDYQPLLIIARKAPHMINFWIIISLFLNLPFSGKWFYVDSIRAIVYPERNVGLLWRPQPITMHKGIFVFSLFILLLQLIFTISHHLLHKEKNIDKEKLIISNNISPAKRITLYLVFVFLTSLFVLQIIFTNGSVSQESILFFNNPNISNLNMINTPPSARYWFGTDQDGRDIFSRVFFSISSFIIITVLFAIINFRIAMDFMNVTSENVNTSTKMKIFQVIGNVPILPVLVLLSVALKFTATSFLFYFYIALIISIISWAKVADLVERNNISINGISYFTHPIILHTMSTFMIDITLLTILYSFGDLITFGNILWDAIGNEPLVFWWEWAFPIMTLILFISFFRSSKLKT